MVLGRDKELQFLEEKYELARTEGQLVVLYGRRRIGKTELLIEFCKEKRNIFFTCVQKPNEIQLRDFSRQVLAENQEAARFVSESFEDWEAAFSAMADISFGDEPTLVVIDEFPYMCKGDESIPSCLQKLWDLSMKNRSIMLILCGSSMSFIENEILAYKNPLYGRTTGIYKLQEMSFSEAALFFPNYNAEDLLVAYSILGGVPQYLCQWDANLSVEENIKQRVLNRGSALYDEVEYLLRQELREPALYNAIIEAIALGATTLNEISQKSLINNATKAYTYIKNLMDLGLIRREFSVDARDKESGNKNRGNYSLTDNFFRFWYTFAMPYISLLERRDLDGLYHYVIEPQLHHFAAKAFEDVCKEYLWALNEAGELPFWFIKCDRWFGKTPVIGTAKKETLNTEIDILAYDMGQNNYIVGECKFKNEPFAYSDYVKTKAKVGFINPEANIWFALFSANGFDDAIAEAAKSERILLYDLQGVVERFKARNR